MKEEIRVFEKAVYPNGIFPLSSTTRTILSLVVIIFLITTIISIIFIMKGKTLEFVIIPVLIFMCSITILFFSTITLKLSYNKDCYNKQIEYLNKNNKQAILNIKEDRGEK